MSQDLIKFFESLEKYPCLDDIEIYYIASPYKHKDKNIEKRRYEAISKITAEIIEKYPKAVVFSPISYTHSLAKDFNVNVPMGWYLFDLVFLSKCSKLIVAKLPGWEKSTGVLIEIAFAKGAGIPMEFYEYETEDQ